MPASARTEAAPSTRSWIRWAVVALLNLGAVIAYIDRTNISVALASVDFKALFHLTDTDRGNLNAAFFWSYAVLQIPAGWLVDRYGVKKPYAIGFLFWSVVSAATALAGSIGQIFALRFLLGIGEAIITPASMRFIRFHFAEKERGLAVGLYMTGTKIGPAVGAPVAAALIQAYDWRVMFMILGLGSLVWLIPWMVVAPRDAGGAPPPAPGKAAVAPVSFGRIMASPVIWGTIVGTFCYMYFVYFCMTWMPAYFVERRHLSLTSMGLYTFFSFAGMAIVAAAGGWAADRMIARGGNPVRVRKAFTIAGFLMASTEVIGALSPSVDVALFFAVFSLSGLGLATANYWALTQTLIPGGAIGRIVGIQNCAANLPGIVAPILTGWLKQRTGSYDAPMQAIWFFLLLGIAAYVFLVREKYAPADDPGKHYNGSIMTLDRKLVLTGAASSALTLLTMWCAGAAAIPATVKLENARIRVSEVAFGPGAVRERGVRGTDQVIVFLDDSRYQRLDPVTGETTVRERKSGDVIWHAKGEDAPRLTNAGDRRYRTLVIELK